MVTAAELERDVRASIVLDVRKFSFGKHFLLDLNGENGYDATFYGSDAIRNFALRTRAGEPSNKPEQEILSLAPKLTIGVYMKNPYVIPDILFNSPIPEQVRVESLKFDAANVTESPIHIDFITDWPELSVPHDILEHAGIFIGLNRMYDSVREATPAYEKQLQYLCTL